MALTSDSNCPQSVAVILGSAYRDSLPEKMELEEMAVSTKYGEQKIYRTGRKDRSAYLLFRHGLPHRFLPNQIPYRRQAAALQEIRCGALLVTSSVGVLVESIPLFKPLLLDDLIMLENRLPDGSACSMFETPSDNHGHLVFNEGPFSISLSNQVKKLGSEVIANNTKPLVFAYVGGPRGKTAAENRMWPKLGAHVNSMTLAPEVILANECGIPAAGLVVGHKYSIPDRPNPESSKSVTESLEQSRTSMEKIIQLFLMTGEPVPFENQIYRFR